MTNQADPATVNARLETLKIAAGSLAMLAIIGAVVGGAFFGAHRVLLAQGLSRDLLHSAYIWVGVGAACGLFWPLRYFGGMRGHWLSALPGLLGLSLTGPFALLLGFPL